MKMKQIDSIGKKNYFRNNSDCKTEGLMLKIRWKA